MHTKIPYAVVSSRYKSFIVVTPSCLDIKITFNIYLPSARSISNKYNSSDIIENTLSKSYVAKLLHGFNAPSKMMIN